MEVVFQGVTNNLEALVNCVMHSMTNVFCQCLLSFWLYQSSGHQE